MKFNIVKSDLKKKIWIVDDDRVIGNIICDYFRANTLHEPYYFSCVPDATKALKSQTPDIMLLDWIMPEISGLDFLIHLRQNKNTKNLPIFMLTGLKSGLEFEHACNAADLNGYFTKPVNLPLMARRIEYHFAETV